MRKETVTIKKLGINGEGIAYINQKITFVKGALIDEEVLIEIVNEKKNYQIGKLVKVIKPSESRVEKKCFQSNECLACPLLPLKYSNQLEFKSKLIEETLNKYTNINLKKVEIGAIIPNDQQAHFKNVVKLPITRFKNKLTFGIYQRDSKFLTLMSDCYVQNKVINSVLKMLEKIFEEHRLSDYNDRFKTGLRFLIAREFDHKIQLIFITGRNGIKERALEAIAKIKQVESVYVSVNTSKYQEFELERYDRIYGVTSMPLYFNQLEFQVSVKSDIPVHVNSALRIAKLLPEFIGDDVKSILEINGGIGLYSMKLSDKYVVKSIDEVIQHTNDGIKNAERNQKSQISFESGDLNKLAQAITKNKPIDLLLVHNDREPLSSDMVGVFKRSKAKYIIYISDNISSTAKDIHELSTSYQLEKIQGIDSLSHSSLVTTISLLKRK